MKRNLRQKCRRLRLSLSDAPMTSSTTPIVGRGSGILTLGSCFALEVQRWMERKGYNVLCKGSAKAELIWYNTQTILAEFERASGEWRQADDDVWDLGDGRWQDPYRRCVFAATKRELLASVHAFDLEMSRAIREADVVIVTLGLTEVWVQGNGRAICASPGYCKGGGQGCSFVATGYGWNRRNVQRSVDLLRQVNPDANVVLTVSPVPLFSTFREMDQLVANTASKSILRAVADEVTQSNGNVHYFHSYELAVGENRSDVYKVDGRHVKPDYVDFIMQDFRRLFVE